MIKLTTDQQKAVTAVREWHEQDSGHQQVFKLFGYAGTGKTTLAKHIAESISEKKGDVVFASFTGKATHVLKRKGCRPASTIHGLIYEAKDKTEDEFEELLQSATTQTHKNRLNRDFSTPHWVLKGSDTFEQIKLLIIDECSMINKDLALDLLSFNIPILALGDPAQLPPVKGAGYFSYDNPDYMLTEIHRQAKDDPIIHLATLVRNGERLTKGDYGESRVLAARQFNNDMATTADQIIVGRNKTRTNINKAIRKILHNPPSALPVKGEKLICLQNQKFNGSIFNGSIWITDKVYDVDESNEPAVINIDMHAIDEPHQKRQKTAHLNPFLEKEIFWKDKKKEIAELDYGYAITCHKSQGSQWEHVLVVDESRCFRETRKEWLYTAITRAESKLTLFI